jgi:2-oxoglutarate dehydrogenase E2 component (dihydrolipoamide succinyltransferase)
MKTDVVVPEIGESISSGIIAAWLKGDGDPVQEGEDLFELETDKATLAVPSPSSGTLTVTAAEGEEVSVGQTVAVIGASEEAVTKKEEKKDKVSFEINIDEKIDTAPDQTEISLGTTEEKSDVAPLSPSVRLLVEQHGLNPTQITGTGKGGRITKKDVLAVLDTTEAREPEKTAAEPTTAVQKPAGHTTVTQKTKSVQEPGQQRVAMTGIRKRIAENLLQAKQQAAHVTTFNEIDMSRVMDLRKTYRDSFESRHGVRLGFMSFFVKACCNALAAFPALNAYIDGDDVVYNNRFNIGIAVSTERGLIVPVIRDADRMGFADIEKAIRSFAEKARDKKITVDELTGGTFTITNGGVFGSMLSTPIPSPPQSAILGMHAIKERPVAVNGELLIHPVMYVALTYDHRLIDGREAVSFLVLVKEEIEDPERMLIDI